VPGSPAGREMRVVPLWHCFGSEELSSVAGGTAELAQRPYVALAPETARQAGLSHGDEATVTAGEASRRLSVRVVPGMAPACAGIPMGLAGFENAWADFRGREVTLARAG
jgi:NADH-quinone oxidoreductase subunit G